MSRRSGPCSDVCPTRYNQTARLQLPREIAISIRATVRAIRRGIGLAATLGLLVSMPAATQSTPELVYSETVTGESLLTAREAIRKGISWLVFTDGQRYMTRGVWEIKDDTLRFRALSGQLLSTRLETIDLEATKALNANLRSGHYVDEALLAWSKVTVHPLTLEERIVLFAELREKAIDLQEKLYSLEDTARCGGYLGVAAELCYMSRRLGRPSPEETVDRAIRRERVRVQSSQPIPPPR